ncbi:mycofactocin biosynthesis glycosyltransferase MftF [Blastococcus sp. TF02A-26]|uniref:mycofactocin biosynthesis glycosyltransferase MftF n=1 Tax=Blastococcus sp. TF02A-26 TaxID=2250577 RepID=UPI001EEC2BE0|nr:mycofactocin biosynthesis glycosyltransferase MftF [Blastococcus sp. TF02A-26]
MPDGWTVRLDPGVRRRDGGTALLGGSPLRLLRLRPRATELLRDDRLLVTDPATAALAGRLLDTGVAHPDLGALPDPGTAVTVVVPVRDRTAGVARLLAALRADPGTAGVPVLVVDDGSADAGGLAAVATASDARVLRSDVSRGPAAARNTGLRAADTPLVAFLDSDCVPRPGWLPVLRRHLADPRLAVVAPRVVALGTPTGRLAAYETAVSALDMGAAAASVRPLTAVSYVPSAALLVRRDALGDGFDESMRVAEDVDLVWRLHAAGWRVRYEPAAEVAHEHPTTVTSWLRRRAFYGTGAALLAQRHGAAVAPVVVSPWSVAALGLAVSGRPAGRLGAAGVLAVATARLARRLTPPGARPPVALAGGLVLRGTATAGRTLTRAALRHHWPLAVAAAVLSPRARAGLAVAAVADGLAAWWPHRRTVGLAPFVAARRAEDLAYGAGLWTGAVRARSPRALLPASPPPL